ncbi:hypothetical protein QTP88_025712 [Uroleucon formosanum]
MKLVDSDIDYYRRLKDPEVQEDAEDIDEVVNTLLEEMVDAVCDVNPELTAGGDVATITDITDAVKVAEAPPEDEQQERVGDELARKNEAETPPTANHKATRGWSKRIIAATWKGVRRVTRLLLCGCFRGE